MFVVNSVAVIRAVLGGSLAHSDLGVWVEEEYGVAYWLEFKSKRVGVGHTSGPSVWAHSPDQVSGPSPRSYSPLAWRILVPEVTGGKGERGEGELMWLAWLPALSYVTP